MSRNKLLGVLLAFGLATHGWTAPAGAASLQTAGWWWRAQTGAFGLPPPPHVPENGLAVGNGADGPTAISALRFTLDADEINPVLELVVAENLSGDGVALVACPATSQWFGTQAGNWAERPEAACPPGAAEGVASPDATSWTFELGRLHADAPVDVVILPAEASAPFEVSFEPPGPNSLRTTRATASSDPEPPPSPSYESFIPPSATFDGGVDTGRPLAPLAPEGPSGAGPTRPTERREFVNVAAPRQPGPAGDGGDPRLLALVILFGAFAAAVTLGREPLPTPRLLGPMATRLSGPDMNEPSESRGIGRFRRARRGAAPTLR